LTIFCIIFKSWEWITRNKGWIVIVVSWIRSWTVMVMGVGPFFSFTGIWTLADQIKVKYANHWSIAHPRVGGSNLLTFGNLWPWVATKCTQKWKKIFSHNIKTCLTRFGQWGQCGSCFNDNWLSTVRLGFNPRSGQIFDPRIFLKIINLRDVYLSQDGWLCRSHEQNTWFNY